MPAGSQRHRLWPPHTRCRAPPSWCRRRAWQSRAASRAGRTDAAVRMPGVDGRGHGPFGRAQCAGEVGGTCRAVDPGRDHHGLTATTRPRQVRELLAVAEPDGPMRAAGNACTTLRRPGPAAPGRPGRGSRSSGHRTGGAPGCASQEDVGAMAGNSAHTRQADARDGGAAWSTIRSLAFRKSGCVW